LGFPFSSYKWSHTPFMYGSEHQLLFLQIGLLSPRRFRSHR
jgi:hypothetical protein